MSSDDRDENEQQSNQDNLSVPKWTSLPTVDFRSLQHKTLGQILVETQRISERQLVEALNHQQEENNDRKLGEVLIEKGVCL